jgi:hypothetical protein
MSLYHCSCGFAIDDADQYGDHLNLAFARSDDIGTDGLIHFESTAGERACACGVSVADPSELNDHLLMAFVTPDGVGGDGEKHVPTDLSTPERWYLKNATDE